MVKKMCQTMDQNCTFLCLNESKQKKYPIFKNGFTARFKHFWWNRAFLSYKSAHHTTCFTLSSLDLCAPFIVLYRVRLLAC